MVCSLVAMGSSHGGGLAHVASVGLILASLCLYVKWYGGAWAGSTGGGSPTAQLYNCLYVVCGGVGHF